MEHQRCLLLATVTGVKDMAVCYPCCYECYSKLLHDTADHRYWCSKCHTTYNDSEVRQRYRLSLVIADSSSLIHVTVFGKTLEALFGVTATAFKRYTQSVLEKCQLKSDPTIIISSALNISFVGRQFWFGLKESSRHVDERESHSSCPQTLTFLNSQISHAFVGGKAESRSMMVASQMIRADGKSAPTVVETIQSLLYSRRGDSIHRDSPQAFLPASKDFRLSSSQGLVNYSLNVTRLSGPLRCSEQSCLLSCEKEHTKPKAYRSENRFLNSDVFENYSRNSTHISGGEEEDFLETNKENVGLNDFSLEEDSFGTDIGQDFCGSTDNPDLYHIWPEDGDQTMPHSTNRSVEEITPSVYSCTTEIEILRNKSTGDTVDNVSLSFNDSLFLLKCNEIENLTFNTQTNQASTAVNGFQLASPGLGADVTSVNSELQLSSLEADLTKLVVVDGVSTLSNLSVLQENIVECKECGSEFAAAVLRKLSRQGGGISSSSDIVVGRNECVPDDTKAGDNTDECLHSSCHLSEINPATDVNEQLWEDWSDCGDVDSLIARQNFEGNEQKTEPQQNLTYSEQQYVSLERTNCNHSESKQNKLKCDKDQAIRSSVNITSLMTNNSFPPCHQESQLPINFKDDVDCHDLASMCNNLANEESPNNNLGRTTIDFHSSWHFLQIENSDHDPVDKDDHNPNRNDTDNDNSSNKFTEDFENMRSRFTQGGDLWEDLPESEDLEAFLLGTSMLGDFKRKTGHSTSSPKPTTYEQTNRDEMDVRVSCCDKQVRLDVTSDSFYGQNGGHVNKRFSQIGNIDREPFVTLSGEKMTNRPEVGLKPPNQDIEGYVDYPGNFGSGLHVKQEDPSQNSQGGVFSEEYSLDLFDSFYTNEVENHEQQTGGESETCRPLSNSKVIHQSELNSPVTVSSSFDSQHVSCDSLAKLQSDRKSVKFCKRLSIVSNVQLMDIRMRLVPKPFQSNCQAPRSCLRRQSMVLAQKGEPNPGTEFALCGPGKALTNKCNDLDVKVRRASILPESADLFTPSPIFPKKLHKSSESQTDTEANTKTPSFTQSTPLLFSQNPNFSRKNTEPKPKTPVYSVQNRLSGLNDSVDLFSSPDLFSQSVGNGSACMELVPPSASRHTTSRQYSDNCWGNVILAPLETKGWVNSAQTLSRSSVSYHSSPDKHLSVNLSSLSTDLFSPAVSSRHQQTGKSIEYLRKTLFF